MKNYETQRGKAETDALKIPLSLGCELLIGNEIKAVVEICVGFVRGTQ